MINMWTYSKLPNEKAISNIEMLTLILTPHEFTKASNILKIIDNNMGAHYIAAKGTIYPILHRLVDREFLEMSVKQRSKLFRRTQIGDNFIISISNTLINQLKSNHRYFEIIIKEIIEIDSSDANDLLDDFIIEIDNFREKTDKLKKLAEDQEDEWSDIPVS